MMSYHKYKRGRQHLKHSGQRTTSKQKRQLRMYEEKNNKQVYDLPYSLKKQSRDRGKPWKHVH